MLESHNSFETSGMKSILIIWHKVFAQTIKSWFNFIIIGLSMIKIINFI